MQAFGRNFMPQVLLGSSSPDIRQTPSGDSDSDDAQNVERLVYPYQHPMRNSYPAALTVARSQRPGEAAPATPSPSTFQSDPTLTSYNSSFVPPPTLALNSVPFTFSSYANPQIYSSRETSPVPPITEANTPTFTSTNPNLVLIPRNEPRRQRQRTPSPRGSKRNSPQPSPERGIRGGHHEDGQQESGASKVRLLNIEDPQKDAMLKNMRQLIANSNRLLEQFGQELKDIKAQAERAETRAVNAEKALEDERIKAELRIQKLESDLKKESSRQIHDAEKRAEVILKSMKNMEQAIRPEQIGRPISVDTDTMAVDKPENDGISDKGKKRAADAPPQESSMPKIPVPPRFPAPSTISEHANQATGSSSAAQPSSIPKPLSFKRPKSNGKPISKPPLNRSFLHMGGSNNDSSAGDSEDEAHDEEAPRRKSSKLNISDLNGEEMLKLLLTSVGVETANLGSTNMKSSGRRRAHPDFKEPVRKAPKARGKQDLMNWIQKHLHHLLGIEKSREILNFAPEIYASHTPLQRHMEQWEKTKEGEPPKVKPMKINWNNFDGPWNTHLCELFVQYCANEGLEGGNSSDEVKEFVAGYFWDRLVRLRRVIKKSRPKGNETLEQTSTRAQGQHLQALIVARRNSRRNQKYYDRIDTCLENLPENASNIVTDDQRDWKTRHDMVLALGPEGMSSDETDEGELDTYWVRKLPWRNKRATQTVIAIDNAKNTTNGYGNVRAGNRPRNRQRKKNATNSARKVPTGKAKSLYDLEWYETLTAGNKRALKLKSDIEYESCSLD